MSPRSDPPRDRPDTPTDQRVRRYRSTDAPALRSLQSQLREPSPALLEAALDGLLGRLFVSPAAPDSQDRPVGYLLCVDDAGEGAHVDGTEDRVHVAELVVAPGHRREGRASELLSACLDTLPPGTDVTLTVAADDERARSFYTAVGFTERRTLRGQFESGTAVLLGRRL